MPKSARGAEVGFDDETGEAIKADKLVDAKGKKYNESGTIAKSQPQAHQFTLIGEM